MGPTCGNNAGSGTVDAIPAGPRCSIHRVPDLPTLSPPTITVDDGGSPAVRAITTEPLESLPSTRPALCSRANRYTVIPIARLGCCRCPSVTTWNTRQDAAEVRRRRSEERHDGIG